LVKTYTYRHIVWLSLPHVFSLLIEPFSSLVDVAVVGRMDQIHLGALSIALGIFTSIGWMFNFLVHGATADIAQNLDNRDYLKSRIGSIFVFAFAMGVAVAFLLQISRSFLFIQVFGADLELLETGEDYYFIRLFGVAWFFLLLAAVGVLRGAQKHFLSFAVVLATTLLNVVLTLFFFFYLKLGMFGVGFATSLSFCVGACLSVICVARYVAPLDIFRASFDFRSLWQFTSKTQHLFYRTLFLLAAYMSAKAVASRMGLSELVAFEILFQLWTLCSYTADGFAVTATSLGALEIGKGRFDRWQVVAHKCMVCGLVLGCLFLVVFLLLQKPITALFLQDSEALDHVNSVWWLLCLAQPCVAVLYVVDGILFGAEDFQWLHRHMRNGVLFVFVPMIFYVAWIRPELLLLWWALLGLCLYRLIGGLRRFQHIVDHNKVTI
jgi:multidrug resistance protein, MATE family